MEYKSQQAGVIFEVVNEAYTTQTCSCCGKIPSSSPKGRAGLHVREWTCSTCGAHHDRDVNAAVNILAALRLERLSEQQFPDAWQYLVSVAEKAWDFLRTKAS